MKAFTSSISNRRNAVTLEKKRKNRFASIHNKGWGDMELPFPFEDALHDAYVPRVVSVPKHVSRTIQQQAKAERRPSKKSDFNLDPQVAFKSKERRRSFVKINDIRRSFTDDAEKIGDKLDEAVKGMDKLVLRGNKCFDRHQVMPSFRRRNKALTVK